MLSLPPFVLHPSRCASMGLLHSCRRIFAVARSLIYRALDTDAFVCASRVHIMHSPLKTCDPLWRGGRVGGKNTHANGNPLVYTRKMHHCARSDGSTCIRIRLNDKWSRTECVSAVRVLLSPSLKSPGSRFPVPGSRKPGCNRN
jgi:hypothetical protein